MTYAIIGSGNVGSAIAGQFARAGIPVSIANTRGPDSLQNLTEKFGGMVSAKTLEEALAADIVFLAVPFTAVETLAAALSNWAGKIIVDQTNAHGVPAEVLAERLSTEVVAGLLPGALVVKAFNQLPAAVLASDPSQDGGKRVVFLASNEDSAAESIKLLAVQLGFSPIFVGRLDEGGRLLHIPGPLVLHNLVEHPLK